MEGQDGKGQDRKIQKECQLGNEKDGDEALDRQKREKLGSRQAERPMRRRARKEEGKKAVKLATNGRVAARRPDVMDKSGVKRALKDERRRDGRVRKMSANKQLLVHREGVHERMLGSITSGHESVTRSSGELHGESSAPFF